jgi:hypothetical protein
VRRSGETPALRILPLQLSLLLQLGLPIHKNKTPSSRPKPWTASPFMAQWRDPRISFCRLPLFLPLPLQLSLPSSPPRHFDRSCSRFCEQRSGETRFSTLALGAPVLAVASRYSEASASRLKNPPRKRRSALPKAGVKPQAERLIPSFPKPKNSKPSKTACQAPTRLTQTKQNK